jgi:hypothetical protein
VRPGDLLDKPTPSVYCEPDRARYPSGKGEVCKTFIRRFDSDPRLQHFFRINTSDYIHTIFFVLILCYRQHMGIPYTCGVMKRGKPCGREARAAYYREKRHTGWYFLCSAHIPECPANVRETLMWLTEESPEELKNRALPSGEDR